jgi:low affinity Fe/Cu permease
MTKKKLPDPPTVELPDPPEVEGLSIFDRIADRVSIGMGRPLNIGIWLVVVIGWTALFAAKVVPASGSFLPAWFVGQGYNFPLNLVTTVLELFIGFLVGAASNRSERNLETTLSHIGDQGRAIADVENKLSEALRANTELTQEIHELVAAVHNKIVVLVPTPAPPKPRRRTAKP